MNKCSQTLSPECFGQARLRKHCRDPFPQYPICPLCNPILLWSVSHRMLPNNSTSLQIVVKICGHMFPPLSSLSLFIDFPVCFSAYALNILKAPKVSLFRFIGTATFFLEQSSMNTAQ